MSDVQKSVMETSSDSGILQPVGDAKGILQIKIFYLRVCALLIIINYEKYFK